jgi:prepilin-type N-terminal cleavage/methylation domain-containing protein
MIQKRAFTLTEMMVVIAVIAILAALLFPAISAAKARARRTTCLNNLRQINLGVRMYADDSSEATPSAGAAAARTNHFSLYSGYEQLMKNYLGLNDGSSPRAALFACPSDTFYPNFFPPHTNLTGYYVRQSLHENSIFDYSSYAFNGGDNVSHTFGTTNQVVVTEHGLTGLKFSSIRHPARTILVAEVSSLAPWSWHDPRWPDVPREALTSNDARNMVSFVDGHVSYIKIYWNNARYPNGGYSFAMNYDPPAGYDYQWSGD